MLSVLRLLFFPGYRFRLDKERNLLLVETREEIVFGDHALPAVLPDREYALFSDGKVMFFHVKKMKGHS